MNRRSFFRRAAVPVLLGARVRPSPWRKVDNIVLAFRACVVSALLVCSSYRTSCNSLSAVQINKVGFVLRYDRTSYVIYIQVVSLRLVPQKIQVPLWWIKYTKIYSENWNKIAIPKNTGRSSIHKMAKSSQM